MILRPLSLILLLASAIFSTRCTQSAMKQANPMLDQNPADHYTGAALEMAEAIRRKNHAALQSLAESNKQAVSSEGIKGMPLLVWAMGHNDAASAEILLRAGARPDVTFPYGNWKMSAIGLASGAEDPRFLQLLLAHKANPNGAGDTEPPIFTAIKSNRHDRVPVLIKAGADINRTDSAGKTALHLAALSMEFQCALSLVNMGANPRAATKTGMTVKTIIDKFPLDPSHPQHAAQMQLSAMVR